MDRYSVNSHSYQIVWIKKLVSKRKVHNKKWKPQENKQIKRNHSWSELQKIISLFYISRHCTWTLKLLSCGAAERCSCDDPQNCSWFLCDSTGTFSLNQLLATASKLVWSVWWEETNESYVSSMDLSASVCSAGRHAAEDAGRFCGRKRLQHWGQSKSLSHCPAGCSRWSQTCSVQCQKPLVWFLKTNFSNSMCALLCVRNWVCPRRLQTYLKAFRGATAETKDLWQHIEAVRGLRPHTGAVYLLTSAWCCCAICAGSSCQEQFHCAQSDEALDRTTRLPRHQHQHHQWRNRPETVPVQRLLHIRVRPHERPSSRSHINDQWMGQTSVQLVYVSTTS